MFVRTLCRTSMTDCYHISLDCEESEPYLPSVECAVVLTMADSTRMRNPTFDEVRKLCRRTYVQTNQGYGKCPKEDWVTSSNTDLIHAYKNVCKHFRNIGGNILIVEDDAQLMSNATRTDFDEVDRFLLTGTYDLYTLGSMGVMRPIRNGHSRIKRATFTQAIVWTPWAREKLLHIDLFTHIDRDFVSKQNTVTYKIPLVVQLFPGTENRRQWCTFCSPANRGIESVLQRIHLVLLYGLSMDTSTTHWTTAYRVGKLIPIVMGASVWYIVKMLAHCENVPIRTQGIS